MFTDEKSRLPDTGEAQVYIAVQDICLDHADVSRRAKARHRKPDTQWLDAEVVEVIGGVESDHHSLAPTEQSALGAAQEQELAITLLRVIRLPFAALTTADDMLRIALS